MKLILFTILKAMEATEVAVTVAAVTDTENKELL